MIRWPAGFVPPSTLLAVDPGRHHFGWALFLAGVLERAGIEKISPDKDAAPPTYRQGDTRAVTTQASHVLAQRFGWNGPWARGGIEEMVVEEMRVYPGDRKSQPASLLPVALTAGMIIGAVSPRRVRVVPAGSSGWKGSMSDQATWNMIRKPLTDPEIRLAHACKVYDDSDRVDFHHGLEAIGIGLWALWRI